MTTPSTKNLRSIRLEAATACQLKCPACPTASGKTGERLGVGFLKFADFKRVVDANPQLSHIELSNWGEIFLNKDLPAILKYAYQKNVGLTAANGANLNTVSEEVLEALVKYRFRALTCSVDGASPQTYAIYRVKGDFNRVMGNIRTINKYKAQYHSPYPELNWQFVVFGHNEHEIPLAKKMAAELNMKLKLKLSWDDLYSETFSPVKDRELVRREIEFGVADRAEFSEKYGKVYMKRCCLDLWKAPQINHDGRILGCTVNYWDDYGNVFKDGLALCLNGERMRTAREMLMGRVEAQSGIPCNACTVYKHMRELNDWITPEETGRPYVKSRNLLFVENKLLGDKWTGRLVNAIGRMRDRVRVFHEVRGNRQGRPKRSSPITAGIYPLPELMTADQSAGWQGYPLFSGGSTNVSKLTCHTSVLDPGACPHPPHRHPEEELLVLLDGELDVILPELKGTGGKNRRLKVGGFLYYPADFPHTIRTVSDVPAKYVMFKWINTALKPAGRLEYDDWTIPEAAAVGSGEDGMAARKIFAGSTECLKKLHGHATCLAPGAGYDPHVDKHDVAIIMLEGEVETLNQRAARHNIIYYPAGTAHGMRNAGTGPARYLVFEFHARSGAEQYPVVAALARIMR
ncbi:MAG: cupin domain-containing protein [Candidatus Omnitrophica bacterium]|nr:cupin domain-containing protein [Candidatus Omnitrophota bacterium]